MNDSPQHYSSAARCSATLICVLTSMILLLRVWLMREEQGSVLASISHLSQFFTILTNALVAVFMLWVGRGGTVSRTLTYCLIVAIVGVGAIYHLLLAHLWSPQGMTWLADQGVHTAVPVATTLWWLAFSPGTAVRWSQTLLALLWPLVYALYAVSRAQFSGFYPYPFLDLHALGWGGLAKSVVMISLGFLMLGVFIRAIHGFSARLKS